MEYNKNTFCKANDKKVLHKIRKHWVVVSTALLMALGGGAAATTHVSAHADANNNNGANTSSTDTVKENLNQKLQTPQQNNNAQSASNNNQSAQAQNSAKQASANSNNNTQQLTPSNILKAAANLHGQILGNAAKNGANAQANNNAAQQNQSQQSGNGFNAPKVNNNGAKANTTNPLKGVAPKMQVGQSNPAAQANANNNKVDFTRPRTMLGLQPYAGAPDYLKIYPSSLGYTWDPNTNAAVSDYSQYNSDDGSSSDFGEITVSYVDDKPGDGDYQVGAQKHLVGWDGDSFNDINHYVNSIPPQQGPYGTGYHLDSSHKIDSGSHITNFEGGKDLQLTIDVQPNAQPELPGQVEVEYQNAYNNRVLQSHLYTYSDGKPFDQQGFIDNPLVGYKVDHVSADTVSSDGSEQQIPNNEIQNFNNANRQVLHIYLKSNTNDYSGQVKYINESDGSEIGPSRTIYGNASESMNNNGMATDYVPSGYTFDPSYSNQLDGHQFNGGIYGDPSTSFQSDDDDVMYVAVKKGTPTNAVSVKYGTINVNYQTSDGNGHNTTIDVLPTTDPSGSHFDISDYNHTVPDGYSYAGKNNSNGVSTYESGQDQNVYITVAKNNNQAVPSQVSNAYIQYMSVDPSDPSAAPQVINDPSTNNYKFPLYGAPGTPINYDQYTSNPPQGYVYEGMGNHNENMYSNQTNQILVESTKAPNDNQQNGYVQVRWVATDGEHKNQTVHISDYEEPAGFDWESDQTSPWTNISGSAPYGYSDSITMPATVQYNKVKAGQTDIATVYVDQTSSDDKVDNTKVTDNIVYDVVDPNTDKVIHPRVKSMTTQPGKVGTPINYLPYIQQDVPSGYTFYKFGSPVSPDYESNTQRTDHIDIISKDHMPSPIYINYINQDGENVDSKSPLDNEGMPEDYDPIVGNLGDTYGTTSSYGSHDISDIRKVPDGYSLAPGQNNVTVSVSTHPQTIDLMVDGEYTSPQTLNIKRVISDANGHELTSDTIPVTISGSTGDVRNFNISDYMPTPSGHYLSDGDKSSNGGNYNVELGNGNLVQGNNGDGTEGTSIGNNNTITFAYTDKQATGNFVYEDTSDGDAVVGNKQVTTSTPGQTMNSDTYKSYGLTTLLPAGYQLNSKAGNKGIASSNNPRFLDGQTYVIYVDSAHTQGSNSTKRTGYGYVTVNYQESDGKGHWNTVATETASGSSGSTFTGSQYTTPTSNNGYMPDAYTNPTTTPSDSSVTQFDKTKTQDYNVHVQAANNTTNSQFGQNVEDQINYVLLDNKDNIVNPNPYKTIKINGPDGSPINYDQYTHIVPAGYNYAGMASDVASYSLNRDSNGSPIATIYIKKSAPFSHNTIPGYHPANTPQASDGKGHKAPGSSDTTYNPSNPNAQSGNYFPWSGGAQNNGTGSAVLDGPENPFDPITAPGYTYNSDAPTMPNSYEYDNKGVLPKGYMPAWVPSTKGDYGDKNNYVSGYVPSDDIPSDYEAGFVPNGNGGYVPGFIPMNTAVQPGTGNQTNGGKKIPKYVPSKVPNGNGGTTNGGAPDQSPYASNTSSTLNVQYVDAGNGDSIIQTVPVQGSVGSYLDFRNPNNSTYLYDIPSGYTFKDVVGQQGTGSNSGKYYHKDNTSDGFDNVVNSDQYGFSDTTHTIRVELNKEAVGTVVYEDADHTNSAGQHDYPEVGSAMVDGAAGTNLDFTNSGKDYKYMQLLPYNFNNPTVYGSTKPVLNNGGVYVIDVHEAHDHNAPAPDNSRKGYGKITINYRDADNTDYILATDNLVGANNTNVQNASDYTKPGYIPYGYSDVTNGDSVNTELQNDQFNSDNPTQVININVKPSQNKSNVPVQGHDKIEYVEEGADGHDHVMTEGVGSDAGKPVPAGQKNAGSTPMLFDVTGDAGSTIDYTPYQINVPSGYFYAGMGTHSTVIDSAHSTSANPDVIYVKPASFNQAYKRGSITINYKDNNGNIVGSVKVTGNDGQEFDSGYYEDNTPQNYVYSGTSSDVRKFTDGAQTDTINVHPRANAVKQYGTIDVYYQDANGNTLPLEGHKDHIVIYGLIGSFFDPEDYEENAPAGYNAESIVSGDNIRTFKENADGTTNQKVVISVSPEIE